MGYSSAVRSNLLKEMESLVCLVLGLAVLPNTCQASFVAVDASNNCLDGNCKQESSLKRQILEEILAEIEEEDLALQRQLELEQHSRLQQQEIEQQQRQLIFQQEQHLREQQILNQRLPPQDQQQVQQRQLRQQIHHLMELELPQNNQLIDSLTEKTYEIALICTNSKCARDFVFDRMKVEITKVIESFTDVFIARMVSLLTPEIIAVNKII